MQDGFRFSLQEIVLNFLRKEKKEGKAGGTDVCSALGAGV